MKCPKCGSEEFILEVKYLVVFNTCIKCGADYSKAVKYQQRLERVLSKFNLTYQGCGDLYIKLENALIGYANEQFTLGSDIDNQFVATIHNLPFEVVESLVNNVPRDIVKTLNEDSIEMKISKNEQSK
jgi:hypothetical protein